MKACFYQQKTWEPHYYKFRAQAMRDLETSTYVYWMAALGPPWKEASLAYWETRGHMAEEQRCSWQPASTGKHVSGAILKLSAQPVSQLNAGPSMSTDETNRRTTETTHRTRRSKKSLCQARNLGVVCYISWDNWHRPTSILLGLPNYSPKQLPTYVPIQWYTLFITMCLQKAQKHAQKGLF